MWPMRNAWRTMLPGSSSPIGAETSAASSAGSGGSPSIWLVIGAGERMLGERGDGAEDLVRRVRLGHIALHAEHLRPNAVCFLILAGDQHHRDSLGGGFTADGARGCEAVHLVHVDVHENDVGKLSLGHLHGLLAAGGRQRDVTGTAHDLLEIHEIGSGVVDDQNLVNGHSAPPADVQWGPSDPFGRCFSHWHAGNLGRYVTKPR